MANFNISNFISELNNNGTQLNSKFDVIVTLPNVLLGKFNVRDGFNDVSFLDQSKLLSMRCDQATLPGVVLGTSENNRYGTGVREKMPYGAAFTPVSLSFITDKNGNINNFWYMWLNLITNFSDSTQLFGAEYRQYTLNYKDDFVSNIMINKYDEGGEKIQTIVLNKAFPLSLNDQPLSWQDNSLSRSIVSITFKDWYYEGSSIGLP